MITVIGLGVHAGDLTLRGAEAIKNAERVILKTTSTPAAAYIKQIAEEVVCLDSLYEDADDFDQLNGQLAERVFRDNDKNTVYCVPGSGAEDESVIELLKKTTCDIIAGVSKGTEALFVAKATDYTYFSAQEFSERRRNLFDTNLLLILTELNDPYLAGDVKLKLLDIYGAEHPAILNGQTIRIKEVDRAKRYGDGTVLAVLPLPLAEKERYTFGDLVEVIYRLRDPDGCPWDKAQTHETIRGNAIEEAYELVEAVDLDDISKMREESGDVLLQGLFHAVIGDSLGEFTVNDLLTELTHKLISRHTHIFGENKANNSEEALMFWDAAKAKEKGYHSVADKFNSIPKTFSALMNAYKTQKIAAKAGFDMRNMGEAAECIPEELQEFLQETNASKKEMEGGDLLFAVVNILRHADIDPELALNRATGKFSRRVRYISEVLAKDGKVLNDCGMEKFNALWQEAKQAENQ